MHAFIRVENKSHEERSLFFVRNPLREYAARSPIRLKAKERAESAH